MSKIGRKPIELGNVKAKIDGQNVHYEGQNGSGVYHVPSELHVAIEGGSLVVQPQEKHRLDRAINKVWGLSRALLANGIKGVDAGFVRNIVIDGLGFKAVASGPKVTFHVGYSHKIDFELPKGVSLDIDKTGQKLTFRSPNKELVGQVCSLIKSLRPVEPYKGTGIRLTTDKVNRKAGKTKSS
jgi:large subunit ribosomal protein L6